MDPGAVRQQHYCTCGNNVLPHIYHNRSGWGRKCECTISRHGNNLSWASNPIACILATGFTSTYCIGTAHSKTWQGWTLKINLQRSLCPQHAGNQQCTAHLPKPVVDLGSMAVWAQTPDGSGWQSVEGGIPFVLAVACHTF